MNLSLSISIVGTRSVFEVRIENRLIGFTVRCGAFSRVAAKSTEIPALLGEIEMLAAFAVRLIWLLNCFFNCEFNSLIAASFVFPPISIPATRTPLGIPEPTASHATNQIRERAPTEIVEIIAI